MDNYSEILDSHLDPKTEVKNVEEIVASATKRFLNYVIDYAVVYGLFFLFGLILAFTNNQDKLIFLENTWIDLLCTYSTYALYTTLLESMTGKSIGKLITKTHVVTLTGIRPSFINLLGRNFARFIPFNPLSFLGSTPVGWHDRISNTRVIND
jgi:uncharacterized RDD family membrane protein YckC